MIKEGNQLIIWKHMDMEQVKAICRNEEMKYNNIMNWFNRNISIWNDQRPSM